MNIIYQPFFRDSSSDESSISFLDFISGYRPNKTKKEEDTTVKEDTTKETDVKESTLVVTNETPKPSSTTKKFSNKREFIATMLPIYEKVLSQKGLPKDFARMIVAQDGLESAWGSKPSGKFNYGGIKGKGTTLDTKEFVNGKEVKVKDNFRDFKSLEDYATYKVNLLNNKRYNAFSKPISEFADSVFKGGYATDPKYAEKLNKVIASVKNGGVMRFQDGGSLAEGKEWLKNWYHGRIPQLESNWFSNWSGALWDFSIPRYRDLVGNMNRVRAEINPKYVPKDNTFDILDRYSTNALEMLFNDVAKNTTSNKDEKKNDAVYGQLGLKIPVVLRNGYNDPEHYYDYSRGAYDPKTGHWYDRDPESGIELKNPNHPTAFLHHEIEEQLGNKRYQDNTGRYYTFSEEETPKYRYNYGPLTPILGLKEIDYPSYGEDRVDMKESIANNPRVRYIWDHFVDAGATPEQAAAILGNFYKENRIKPDSKKSALGLAQLMGERRKAYEEFLKNNNKVDSTESQIEYLTPIIFGNESNPHNLVGDYTYTDKNGNKNTDKYDSYMIDWNRGQRKAFRNAKGLDDLTVSFANNFERMNPEDADYQTRKEAARYIYDLMTK